MNRSRNGCSYRREPSSPGSIEGDGSLHDTCGSCRDTAARLPLAEIAAELGRRPAMRSIKTSTGVAVLLDGDLLAIMEVLYREVTARHELERSFDDMNREIANLIEQMSASELRKYLQEALFVNTITYENQKAAAYMRSVAGSPRKRTLRPSRQRHT